jgi:hypothetical protein
LHVHDADLEAYLEDGPLAPQPAVAARMTQEHAEAVLCDQQLTIRQYARFRGAELVAELYDLGVPAVLCTTFDEAQLDLIRPYRRRIPALIVPAKLTDDVLLQSIETCLRELVEGPGPARRPIRTQVVCVDRDDQSGTVYVSLPGWISDEPVRLLTASLAPEIAKLLRPEARVHAEVNLGADRSEDLFFDSWEKQ